MVEPKDADMRFDNNSNAIRLWRKFDDGFNGDWTTEGSFGQDAFMWFYLPYGVRSLKSKDLFQLNVTIKWVYKPVKIPDVSCIKFWNSGSNREQSVWKTCDVNTESFWHGEQYQPPDQQLFTDHEQSGLPFIWMPPANEGMPDTQWIKSFFIPLIVDWNGGTS